ncbi:unnamed protein product [Cylicocyclus nassatus]|uniref:RNB domain-containing protein n=1 Tax=Cylicocyclus nassatus TaxID=53992 RepID=A0AA36DPX3_CYLNA|nr:unnamed protein product [Cylicocyclus nassatus]
MDLCKAAKDGEELGKRRDLRDEIIFTIDPKTARLDDALSVVPCDDVNGVDCLAGRFFPDIYESMELARYCTGSVKSQTYHHFALNVPFYTQFTSPIRLYPDRIVHRSLDAALGYCEPSERSVEDQKIAEHCNDKKLIAKKVSEFSAELFFGVLIHRVGPTEAKGVVVNVLDAAFDVLLFKYGVIGVRYNTVL